MEKKIVVPEGMLKAAFGLDVPALWTETPLCLILERSLRWLRENPIEPTEVQQREIAVKMAQYQVARMGKFETSDYHIWFPIVEWQRRMFLAASEPCDNPVVKGVVDRFRGITLSRAEADYIIENVNMVTHG
jgi:hypothetical protein